MSKDELDQIAQEVAPIEEGAEDGREAPGEGGDGAQASPEPDPVLTAFLAQFWKVAGALVCSRFKVSALADQEVAQMAVASANVASHYSLPELSPRAAAWIGLGMTACAVALPRIQEYAATIDAEPEPANENETDVPDQVFQDADDIEVGTEEFGDDFPEMS